MTMLSPAVGRPVFKTIGGFTRLYPACGTRGPLCVLVSTVQRYFLVHLSANFSSVALPASHRLCPKLYKARLSTVASDVPADGESRVRLSKLLATYGQNMCLSRRTAEGLIRSGQVTVAGATVTDPTYWIGCSHAAAVKVAGRHLVLSSEQQQPILPALPKTRVWLAHKLRGELVTEHHHNYNNQLEDVYKEADRRPSLLDRLYRGGVGKQKNNRVHLKPVGRLDMMTEGLILLTNDGHYARQLELPENAVHRTYRVRVHGRITEGKLQGLRKGMNVTQERFDAKRTSDKNKRRSTKQRQQQQPSMEPNKSEEENSKQTRVWCKGMKVQLEVTNKRRGVRTLGGGTNSWLKITCTEGKNRQIRRMLQHLGLQVTRLIRISFGDYDLNTIPPGMTIEIPVKPLETLKKRGSFVVRQRSKKTLKTKEDELEVARPVEWIRNA